MADFDGYLVENDPAIINVGARWSNPVTRSISAQAGATTFLLVGESEALTGAYQGTLAPAASTSRTGVLIDGVGTDLFTGLVVLPPVTALGSILNPVTTTYSVWNAGPRTLNLSAVTPIGTESLTFTQWLEAPRSFSPFESGEVTFIATPVGPPSVQGTVQYFTSINNPTETITGSRVTTFSLPHNWSSPVKETWEWNVQNLESYDGTYQGQMMSSKPRAEIDTEHLLGHDGRRLMDSFFWGNVDREFLLPLWQDMTYLAESALAGALVLFMDTKHRRFIAGNTASVMTDNLLGEVVEIAEVFDDRLTLTEGTANAWPARSQVMPGVAARLSSAVKAEQLNTEVQRLRIKWEVADMPMMPPNKHYTGPEVEYFSATLQAKSSNEAVEYARPVDWSQPVSESLSMAYSQADFPLATRDYREAKHARNTYAKTYQWTLLGRVNIAEHLGWLTYLQGQYNEFFIPTHTEDLKLVQPVQEGTMDELAVEFVDYAENYAGLPGRSAVRVKYWRAKEFVDNVWVGGEWHYHTAGIIAWSSVGAVDTLTLDEPLEYEIWEEYLDRTSISFVYLAAAGNNEVSIDWVTPATARHTMMAKLRVI